METSRNPAVDPATEAVETLQARTHTTKAEPDQFSVTIGKPVSDVYHFWRNFENLPVFMKDLTDVEQISETRSRWKIHLKSGMDFEWEAEITEEIPNRMIAWKSLEGSSVKTIGSVWFEDAPAGRGTIVRLAMSTHIPGGKVSELAGKVTGEDPYNLTLTNLRRLKAYLETGEIPTTEGQPSGRDEDSEEIHTLH